MHSKNYSGSCRQKFIVVAFVLASSTLMHGSLHSQEGEKAQEGERAQEDNLANEWTLKDLANIEKAVGHLDRPESDKQRDLDRLPVSILSFFQIREGMQVADMMAGGGYYTEILSRAVGSNGKVYAHNNSIALKRFADRAITKRLAESDLPNVVRLDAELEEPEFPQAELDAVMLFLFYHDSYWMGADRTKMNKAVFDALKPGGVFCITDHHAAAGSMDRDVQSLHRVDAELVKREILAAGFVLEAESDILRNADDDRTVNVFRPEIRGKTDRFVFRFRKPADTSK